MELNIARATININTAQDIPGTLEFAFGVTSGGTGGGSDRGAGRDSPQITPPLGQVWPGQGGIYVATVPAMLGLPARHLIASSEETKLRFGPTSRDIAGAKSHGDGIANTLALLADAEKHPAARWCADYRADGHSDFHLPSRFDLLMAFLQAREAFNEDGWYWSSTQFSRASAFVQGFAYGLSGWDGKDDEHRVRAFRWIHLDA
jgi:hypothetical protein